MKTIKKLFYVLYIIVTVVAVGLLGIVIYGAIVFNLPEYVNTISMYIAFFSLPGIIITLLKLVPEKDEKKKIQMKGQCPHCFSKMNYYMEEE